MVPSVSWQDVHSMLAREPDPRPKPNPRPSLTAHRPSEDAASRRRCEDGAMSTTTTIPGELFLLLTDEAGRQATSFRRQALAAAAIAELLLRERIALSERRNPDVEIVDPSPTGEPALDRSLAALAEVRRPRLQSVISHRRMDLTEVLGRSSPPPGRSPAPRAGSRPAGRPRTPRSRTPCGPAWSVRCVTRPGPASRTGSSSSCCGPCGSPTGSSRVTSMA